METSLKTNSLEHKTKAIKENNSKKLLNNLWDKCLDDYENYLKE